MRAMTVLVALAFVAAGCGGESATTSGQDTPSSSGAPGAAVVVVRTGGLAGVHDSVRITKAGAAHVTTKKGTARDCKPAAKTVARLRAVDLAAVAATPTQAPQIADGFQYSVTSGGTTATAGEGDHDSRRAELVDAAADVVASCLAGEPPAPAGY